MNSNKEEDLLLDESFLDWYFIRSEKEITKWNKMIAADEECQQLVEQALLLLASTFASAGIAAGVIKNCYIVYARPHKITCSWVIHHKLVHNYLHPAFN